MMVSKIDKHVGQRIRTRRRDMYLSQQEVGEKIGVTYQQLQKYEYGSNRVPAGRLWQIAKVLGVTVQYFYDGFEGER